MFPHGEGLLQLGEVVAPDEELRVLVVCLQLDHEVVLDVTGGADRVVGLDTVHHPPVPGGGQVLGQVQQVVDVLSEAGRGGVGLVPPVLLDDLLLQLPVEPRLGQGVGDLACVGGDDPVEGMSDHQELGHLAQQLPLPGRTSSRGGEEGPGGALTGPVQFGEPLPPGQVRVELGQPEEVGGPGPAGHFVDRAVDQLVVQVPHQTETETGLTTGQAYRPGVTCGYWRIFA